MKFSKITVLVVLFCILAFPFVYAYAEERHHVTISPPSKFLEGETKSVTATIVNNNKDCDYTHCSWTAEGSSGTTGYITHGGGTATFSFPVTAPQGVIGSFTIRAYATCITKKQVFPACWVDDELSDTVTASYSFCGDGNCDSNENCLSCQPDCACKSGNECVSGQCRSKCGNNRVDPGEDCKTCPTDVRCSSGLYCSGDGRCVQCTLDSHCDAVGTFSRGGSRCSADHKEVIQKGTKTYEKCSNYNCVTTTEDVDEMIDCTLQGTFCQDGTCGCSVGYAVCQADKECVKKNALGSNAPCKCDFQCESNFCDSGRCVEGLIVSMNSDRTALKPGDSTKISISVDNPFNREVKANLVLDIGSGVGISATISGKSCGGSQCTDIANVAENGHHEFPITLYGNNLGTVPLSAKIMYSIPGKKEIEVSKQISIKFTECGREDCTNKWQMLFDYLRETKIEIGNFSVSLLVLLCGVLVLIIILSAVVLTHRTHVKHRPSKKEKERGKKKGEKKQKPVMSVAKEIKRLADLRDKGILTEKEFKKKKKRLLKKE